MPRAKTLIIVITGPMTSGKGAIRHFLVNRGFQSVRFTRPILNAGMRKKQDMTRRENWIKILVEMRKEKGIDILSKLADKKIEEGERYVICPVRHPIDLKYFKDKYNALILYIDAPYKTRYKRTFLKELGSNLTEAQFKRKDDRENNPKGNDKELLPNIAACKKLADEILKNTASLNDLNHELDAILRKYRIPDKIDQGAYEGFEV